MKIGRNDPCPCGSGKKYKQCHLKQGGLSGTSIPTAEPLPMTFDKLLITHSSVQILGVLGALQLYPENHGRNFRIEQMCLSTLRQFNPDDKKTLASWENLKGSIEDYTDNEMMEDPLSNAFSEILIFEEGNYIVYPGLYDGVTEILNQFIECIFLHRNTLKNEFVKTTRDAVGLLSFMSNSVAHEVGHEAFIYLDDDSDNIVLPEYDKTAQLIDALYFTKTYLKDVCDTAKFDIRVLNDFIIEPSAIELDEEDPEYNVVNFKPLVDLKDAILVYMPTGIPNALISYILEKAKEYSCHEELMDLLYKTQFHHSCVALSQSGWGATDIVLPTPKSILPIIETVFQFDNEKLAYVCYIKTGDSNSLDEAEIRGAKFANPYETRTNEVVQYLSTINSEQAFGVFCLYIIGETADNYYFMWSKPLAGNQSLALKYRELWTITHLAKFNSLTLWKFAKCHSRTNESARVMAMGGMMDAYAIFRKNQGSLLHSDEARPLGGMLMVVNGSSDDLRREVQKQQNEHAVSIFYEGKFAYAKVSRFKDYAPIYIEREVSKYFRIVIESYKMPIWITNPQTTVGKDSWGTYTCEAVAFWLNKMQQLLAPYINEQQLIQFEIEISVAKELMGAEKFEIKPININSIILAVRIVPPKICIEIPYDYLYAVMLPDNTADKILMTVILKGIVEYIRDAGSSTTLTTGIIDEIIGQVLKPANAKMLLFSDASANIKMDDRNLPPIRYIDDSDISFVLDNLVSYLPEGYVIPADIPDKKDKIKLCDDVVTALIEQITVKLTAFDGPGILNWLIKLNEKCIQLREFREIVIPAKIACFSDFQTEVDALMDGERNLVTTAHAIRILIEFIATNIPSGEKWPNLDDIDELLALTNQLTDWGALSEAMRMGIDDPKMGLLSSGRIGVDKTVGREAFKPYAVAKTESNLFRNIEDFESNYVSVRKSSNPIETEESKFLDKAFSAEFGIALTTISKIVGALVNEGFTKAISCMEMEAAVLKSLLSKVDGINENDINITLELLTLLERKSIGLPPYGYTPIDIFPWRYSRSISYLRRPLVKVTRSNIAYYYYGYRHLMQFIDNLFYLLYSSKLPGTTTEEMKSWLATASGDKGSPFRNLVKKWFEENSAFEIIPYEVKMDKVVPQGHIKTDKHYGDIDLLVIDHQNKIIYPIECKNIHGGRNVHEMKVEMDDYIGRDGKDKKAKMRKHVERHLWLNANKSSLAELVSESESYSIKSFILTADEIPLAYLKKDDLPLQLKSFAFLRKDGLAYL